jgi:hypothetical protein
VIQIVRLANILAVKNQVGRSGDCSGGLVTPDMLEPLKLTLEDLPKIEEQFQADMERAGAFLSAYS